MAISTNKGPGVARIQAAHLVPFSHEAAICENITRDTQSLSFADTQVALSHLVEDFRVRKILQDMKPSIIQVLCASGKAATEFSVE